MRCVADLPCIVHQARAAVGGPADREQGLFYRSVSAPRESSKAVDRGSPNRTEVIDDTACPASGPRPLRQRSRFGIAVAPAAGPRACAARRSAVPIMNATAAAPPSDVIAVVTTVANLDDARRLARTIVERRLAACAQLAPIESFYVWQGALQNEAEVRVLFKTTRARWPSLAAAIVELHPYALPEIHATECAAVHAPYAQWVADNTGG
jgi:periplasmic divalent cation tolerance protein